MKYKVLNTISLLLVLVVISTQISTINAVTNSSHISMTTNADYTFEGTTFVLEISNLQLGKFYSIFVENIFFTKIVGDGKTVYAPILAMDQNQDSSIYVALFNENNTLEAKLYINIRDAGGIPDFFGWVAVSIFIGVILVPLFFLIYGILKRVKRLVKRY